jgi:hypothetical protein
MAGARGRQSWVLREAGAAGGAVLLVVRVTGLLLERPPNKSTGEDRDLLGR